jgi:hypothetical protein
MSLRGSLIAAGVPSDVIPGGHLLNLNGNVKINFEGRPTPPTLAGSKVAFAEYRMPKGAKKHNA